MSIFDSIKRLFGGPSSDDEAGHALDPAVAAAGEGESITCAEALRLVHDYLDGEVGDVPASRVRHHFEVCARCYPHLKLERAYREAVLRAAAGRAAPPKLKARVTELLAEAGSDD